MQAAAVVIRTIIVAGLAVLAASAQSAPLFTDDFDHGQGATTNFDGLANWMVTDGSVDAFSNGGFGLPCPSLGCLDMDGSTGNAGTIRTKTEFDLGAGEYLVSLNLAGNRRGGSPDSMDLLLGSRLLGSVSVPSDFGYSLVSIGFFVTTAETGALVLDHAGGDNFGILLDRVELRAVGTSGQVPAPATLAVLLLGLVGTAFAGRRSDARA